jgi:aminopeptidase N
VAELLLEAIRSGVSTLERLPLPAARAALDRLAPVVEEALWREASGAEPAGDRQAAAFAAYVAVARSPAALDRLAALLGDGKPPAGLALDPDRRWAVLQTLQARGHGRAAALHAAERERDRSERAERQALAVEAASPQLEVKRRWLATLQRGGDGRSLAQLRAVMGALFPDGQSELQAELLAEVLDALGSLGERDAYFLASYATNLLPSDCSERSVAAMRAALDTPGLHRTLRRFLLEAHEEEARCAAMAGRWFRPAGEAAAAPAVTSPAGRS